MRNEPNFAAEAITFSWRFSVFVLGEWQWEVQPQALIWENSSIFFNEINPNANLP